MPARKRIPDDLPAGPYLQGVPLDSPEGAEVLELFKSRMARRPRCGGTQASTARKWRDRDTALTRRYMQPNHPHMLGTFPLDLDMHSAEAALILGRLLDQRLPAPNLETWRSGGHQQAYWLLAAPVGTSPAHRLRPQRYARSVWMRLRAAFDADMNATGQVMRGLLHPDQRTVAYHTHLWTLDELDAMLPAWSTHPERTGLPASARESRNYAMFRALEAHAHELLQSGISAQAPQFQALLSAEAARLVAQLPQGHHPYTQGELARTLRSVHRRAQAGRCRPMFRTLRRDQLWSHQRPRLDPAEARARQLQPLEAANDRREIQGAEFYLAAARRLVARGEVLTVRNMAQETGRHVRKVKQHAATWRTVQAAAQDGQQQASEKAAVTQPQRLILTPQEAAQERRARIVRVERAGGLF